MKPSIVIVGFFLLFVWFFSAAVEGPRNLGRADQSDVEQSNALEAPQVHVARAKVEQPNTPLPGYYAPTREAFTQWFGSDEAWATEGVPEAWAILQTKREVQTFIIGYQDRELARWQAHQASVPLQDELGPHRTAWLEQAGSDFWKDLALYSEQCVNDLWMVGAEVAFLDDPETRWRLFRALSRVPAVKAAARTIEAALNGA